MSTIVAISTPVGSGGIGVIRISGNLALSIASKLFATKKLESFSKAEPNYMYLGNLDTGIVKEKCFGVYFKAPNSYTGEDVVEFQCHGGITLINNIVEKVVELGATPAERGEFTKRAFINGKLALSDAEGVIEMINADSVANLNVSYRMMEGKLTNEILDIQNMLTDVVARGEASLDYPEELEEEVTDYTREKIKIIEDKLKSLVESYKTGRMVKNGINVAICGKANVGKSSLLNAILKKDRAIVTNIAGTTRDVIEESIEINGVKVNFQDTAGIRESSDVVEQVGVNIAKKIIQYADLVLYLKEIDVGIDEEDKEILELIKHKKTIKVINKIDKSDKKIQNSDDTIYISCKENINIDKLTDKIANIVNSGKVNTNSEIIILERHFNALKSSYENVLKVKNEFEEMEICCKLMLLKSAWEDLGQITGTTANEKIIDAIFSKFCLGK